MSGSVRQKIGLNKKIRPNKAPAQKSGAELADRRPRAADARPRSHPVLMWQTLSRSLAQDAGSVQSGEGFHGRPCRARSQSGSRLLWPGANRGPAVDIAAVHQDGPATRPCPVPDARAACDGPELDWK